MKSKQTYPIAISPIQIDLFVLDTKIRKTDPCAICFNQNWKLTCPFCIHNKSDERSGHEKVQNIIP
jgi:hypothetical protein